MPESIARKITLLLERAQHAATPPHEAAACRAKADALMLKYRIDAATTAAAQPVQNTPEWLEVVLTSLDNEFRNDYYRLATYVANHVGVLFDGRWVSQGGGEYLLIANTVGYKADLEMFEVLWASMRLEFQRRLEPTVDPDRTDAENALIMRMAGMERRRIAAALLPGWSTVNEMKARTRKVGQMVKAEAERQGVDVSAVQRGAGASVKTYRGEYADGFNQTLYSRMRRLREARGEDSAALVLVSRWEQVQEAFWTAYPQYRPVDPSKRVESNYVSRKDCVKCVKAKSGYCRDHGHLKPSRSMTTRPSSNAGYNAGAAAARAVDLGAGGRGRLGA